MEVEHNEINDKINDKINDNDIDLVKVEKVEHMRLEKFLIDFIPPAWTIVFNEMEDELIDAGIIVEADVRKHSVMMVPRKEDIYKAFITTPPDNVKVVVIGMDPYFKVHKNIPSATGRCFECREGMPIEKSLQHIFSVCYQTIKGFKKPSNGNLSKWAEQGVLLMNSSLTTRANQAGCHLGAWRFFPEKVIKYLGEKKKNIVYMLWGKDALEFEKFIPEHRNLILTSSHPVARGNYNTFLGNKKLNQPPINHFNEANEYLKNNGKTEIDWCL